MPRTYWTFLVGTLALCGLPGFSGFYSKDAILAAAEHHGPILFVVAVLVAFLTTFYMSRLFLVAFLGGNRSEEAGHAHESPAVMVWPLMILAVPSVLAGFWGLEAFVDAHWHKGAEAAHGGFAEALLAPFAHAPLPALASLASVVFGFSFAYAFYARAETDPLPARLGALSRAMRDRFYFDEIYSFLIKISHEALSRLAGWLDRWVVAGLGVRGLSGTTELVGRGLRLVQSGNLQTYAFLMVAGLVLVLLFALK